MSCINFSNCKLLLAEDDPDQVIRLRHALKAAGLNPPFWVARDGQETIEFLSREGEDGSAQPQGPTALLLDLRMPKKNGFEVLEWIRHQPALHKLIIIVLTASEDPGDERRAYELGASSYVVKPGDLESLSKLVKTLLTFRLYWDHPERAQTESLESESANHNHTFLNVA